ncbi:MAG TPA: hypothetical protein VF765_35705 [Polyangiaceae bacterium]
MRHLLSRLPIFLVALAGCSSTDSGTLQLVTGPETDVFSASPQPTTLKVIALDSSNSPTTLATATLPTSSIDLGQQDENAVATLAVEGTDSSGAQVVYGASLPVQYGALAGATLPIFVQRTNEFARLPSPPNDARRSPTMAIIGERFLVVGAGSGPSDPLSTQIYDFASLGPLDSPPSLPRVPLSMPVVGTVALLIDGSGATYYDFAQGTGADTTPPDKTYAFGDVAGGQVVYDGIQGDGYDGWVFVVGGTRTSGSPTAAVLAINTNDSSNASYPTGNLHWLSLTAPRQGATATYVSGRGLVVTGGSATAAGVEILAPMQTTGSALPFPPDATIGASSSAFGHDASHVLVAGGLTPTGADAGVRKLDLGCGSNCGVMGTDSWGSLPTPLGDSTTFVLPGDTTALVIGNALPSGATHAFVVDSASSGKPTELQTKVPHSNARAMISPTGTVVLYGGATEIESFTTPQSF